MLIYVFLSITLLKGGKFTVQSIVCSLDSSNCSQLNAFFDSWWKVLSFFIRPPRVQGTFYSCVFPSNKSLLTLSGFHEMSVFMLFDNAVSISFRTIN